MTVSAIERFLDKVEVTESCWLWTGALNDGYGTFGVDGGKVAVHRWAYEFFIGPIPAGLHIDHVRARGCTHRNCVNPDHLEAVTQAENNRRAEHWRLNQTHCKHGHEFTPENTYHLAPTSTHARMRTCRACRAERERARYWRSLGRPAPVEKRTYNKQVAA